MTAGFNHAKRTPKWAAAFTGQTQAFIELRLEQLGQQLREQLEQQLGEQLEQQLEERLEQRVMQLALELEERLARRLEKWLDQELTERLECGIGAQIDRLDQQLGQLELRFEQLPEELVQGIRQLQQQQRVPPQPPTSTVSPPEPEKGGRWRWLGRLFQYFS